MGLATVFVALFLVSSCLVFGQENVQPDLSKVPIINSEVQQNQGIKTNIGLQPGSYSNSILGGFNPEGNSFQNKPDQGLSSYQNFGQGDKFLSGQDYQGVNKNAPIQPQQGGEPQSVFSNQRNDGGAEENGQAGGSFENPRLFDNLPPLPNENGFKGQANQPSLVNDGGKQILQPQGLPQLNPDNKVDLPSLKDLPNDIDGLKKNQGSPYQQQGFPFKNQNVDKLDGFPQLNNLPENGENNSPKLGNLRESDTNNFLSNFPQADSNRQTLPSLENLPPLPQSFNTLQPQQLGNQGSLSASNFGQKADGNQGTNLFNNGGPGVNNEQADFGKLTLAAKLPFETGAHYKEEGGDSEEAKDDNEEEEEDNEEKENNNETKNEEGEPDRQTKDNVGKEKENQVGPNYSNYDTDGTERKVLAQSLTDDDDEDDEDEEEQKEKEEKAAEEEEEEDDKQFKEKKGKAGKGKGTKNDEEEEDYDDEDDEEVDDEEDGPKGKNKGGKNKDNAQDDEEEDVEEDETDWKKKGANEEEEDEEEEEEEEEGNLIKGQGKGREWVQNDRNRVDEDKGEAVEDEEEEDEERENEAELAEEEEMKRLLNRPGMNPPVNVSMDELERLLSKNENETASDNFTWSWGFRNESSSLFDITNGDNFTSDLFNHSMNTNAGSRWDDAVPGNMTGNISGGLFGSTRNMDITSGNNANVPSSFDQRLGTGASLSTSYQGQVQGRGLGAEFGQQTQVTGTIQGATFPGQSRGSGIGSFSPGQGLGTGAGQGSTYGQGGGPIQSTGQNGFPFSSTGTETANQGFIPTKTDSGLPGFPQVGLQQQGGFKQQGGLQQQPGGLQQLGGLQQGGLQQPGGLQQQPGGLQQRPGGLQQQPGGLQQLGGLQQGQLPYDSNKQGFPPGNKLVDESLFPGLAGQNEDVNARPALPKDQQTDQDQLPSNTGLFGQLNSQGSQGLPPFPYEEEEKNETEQEASQGFGQFLKGFLFPQTDSPPKQDFPFSDEDDQNETSLFQPNSQDNIEGLPPLPKEGSDQLPPFPEEGNLPDLKGLGASGQYPYSQNSQGFPQLPSDQGPSEQYPSSVNTQGSQLPDNQSYSIFNEQLSQFPNSDQINNQPPQGPIEGNLPDLQDLRNDGQVPNQLSSQGLPQLSNNQDLLNQLSPYPENEQVNGQLPELSGLNEEALFPQDLFRSPDQQASNILQSSQSLLSQSANQGLPLFPSEQNPEYQTHSDTGYKSQGNVVPLPNLLRQDYSKELPPYDELDRLPPSPSEASITTDMFDRIQDDYGIRSENNEEKQLADEKWDEKDDDDKDDDDEERVKEELEEDEEEEDDDSFYNADKEENDEDEEQEEKDEGGMKGILNGWFGNKEEEEEGMQYDEEAKDDDDDDDDDDLDHFLNGGDDDDEEEEEEEEEREDQDDDDYDFNEEEFKTYNGGQGGANGENVMVENVVDQELADRNKVPTGPSSMVLFYTWMIVAILVVIVAISTYQSKFKGMRFPFLKRQSSREDKKRLLEHEYV